MNMDYTDKPQELMEFLKTHVPEKRYQHSVGVSKMAAHLARIHGVNVEKAEFAGMFHDIAKAYTQDESNALLVKYELPDKYYDNKSLAHSKIGAAILEHEYGVKDEEILAGVRSHTIGRRGMSLFEEIIYVADAIDETREYHDIEYYRELADRDIDQACLEIMDYNIEKVKEKGKKLDEETIDARMFIAEKIAAPR